MKIWTDAEYLEPDANDAGELAGAMYFKAANIKAKADPELFTAVGDMLAVLWKEATERVPVVHGEWISAPGILGYLCCSECHDVYIDPEWISDGKWSFCPNCGATMRR